MGGKNHIPFHGLRKNAAYHLAELGLNDGEIGAVCGMTPDTVRHYTKRKRTKIIAQGAADRIQKGDVAADENRKPFVFNMVTPTGFEPVFQP